MTEHFTAAEERVLFEAMRTATSEQRDRLKQLIVSANLAFARSEASKFVVDDMEDLYQAAVVGMVEAIDRFDVSRGYKFITFAVWHIRMNIHKTINAYGTITIPDYVLQEYREIEREKSKLQHNRQREIYIGELADEMNISLKEASKAYLHPSVKVSLDGVRKTNNKGNESRVGDFVPDTNAENPLEAAGDKNLADTVHALLGLMKPKHAQVLKMYWGLGCKPMTLQEIGESWSMTREGVRQIKIRATARFKELAHGLEGAY